MTKSRRPAGDTGSPSRAGDPHTIVVAAARFVVDSYRDWGLTEGGAVESAILDLARILDDKSAA